MPHPPKRRADGDPGWSPDGSRVVFASLRLASSDINTKRIDDVQPDSPLHTSAAEYEYSEDWSPDGKYIAVVRGIDLAAISVADGTVIPLTNDTFIEDEPHFSPNGKWIAYNSSEPGSSEVYVMPFPPSGRKWIVSSGGGAQPRWRRDGRALYYLSADGTMMSVTLDPATALPTAARRAFSRPASILCTTTTINTMFQRTAVCS
jgi:Tol biopolymer transport system component